MTSETITEFTAIPPLRASKVYGIAALCLVAGLAIGFLLRGPQSPTPAPHLASGGAPAPVPGMVAGEQNIPASPAMSQVAGGQGQPATAIRSPHGPAGAMAGGHMHSLAEMKDAADRQAAPLKEKLKSDPKNTSVLLQLGAIYHATHQFKDAADYYGRAVQTDPKNVATRTKLATSLFRSGDADGAIAQLNQALTYEPKDVNCLYDLGMIRLQGKQDGKGAVAAWQRLLKSNPQLPADRKDAVLKQMADVMTTLDNQHGLQGAQK